MDIPESNTLDDTLIHTIQDTLVHTLGPPGTDLSDVIESTIFDLSAVYTNSYPGVGQLWKNRTYGPADFSPKTTYDFTVGASTAVSTDDPTFVGPAGQSTAYFSVDGADRFRMNSDNTTFMANLHRSDVSTSWWLALSGQHRTPVAGQGTRYLLGTGDPTNNAIFGMTLGVGTDNSLFLSSRGSGVASTIFLSGINFLTNLADYVLIVTYNNATRAFKVYLNSGTPSLSGTAAAFTKTSPATLRMSLGSDANITRPMPNNYRFYSYSMGNSFLTDAQAASILGILQARRV